MPDSVSLRDRYLQLIDTIVQTTLKGKIRSKEQVYAFLVEGIAAGTGEIFEQCLTERLAETEHQAKTQSDEFKQAKADRSLRALKTIQGEWQHWQEKNQASQILTQAVQQIATANGDRLNAFLQMIDPNQPHPLNLAQLEQLANLLQQVEPTVNRSDSEMQLRQFVQGLQQGLASWRRLENDLVSWMYEQRQMGFGGVPGQQGPWALWAQQVNSPLPQALFHTLSLEQSVVEWAARTPLTLTAFIELVIVLRCLQFGLVGWYDKLVYDAKVGAKLSIATFLAFAVIWSQLANGFSQRIFVDGCFQMTLQILRSFAQQSYFPLYGGVFASFSGEYLRGTLSYLDEPLQRAEGTQEKARILTLLGYSARTQGRIETAVAFHQQALVIAREAGDRRCEIANLNHLSRAGVAQTNYAEAIHYSQRALILSRQIGDRLGEANAIANLGYGEVLQAQQLEQVPEYEEAIERLQLGLQITERLGDRQSQALCLSSLGIVFVVIEQFQQAIDYLEQGIAVAQLSGDLYLQGMNLAYLAESQYRLGAVEPALYSGCLAMYLLEQIAAAHWRQPAGLLTILRGQLGEPAFQALLAQKRAQIVAVIGVEGYDYLPQLLEQYRN
jgi:tetratricopeptide (TPR) repeat protein